MKQKNSVKLEKEKTVKTPEEKTNIEKKFEIVSESSKENKPEETEEGIWSTKKT